MTEAAGQCVYGLVTPTHQTGEAAPAQKPTKLMSNSWCSFLVHWRNDKHVGDGTEKHFIDVGITKERTVGLLKTGHSEGVEISRQEMASIVEKHSAYKSVHPCPTTEPSSSAWNSTLVSRDALCSNTASRGVEASDCICCQ